MAARFAIPASHARPEPRAPASRRFAAVGVWANKACEDSYDDDGFEYGPGLAVSAVNGALMVFSLVLSIVALVMAGKDSGAPEAVGAKDKDVEMANAK